ncbi:MAG: hypothetical protein J6T73_04095 [Clostridia bacterium]|nr:hypothetical protein [Clostridia bacterium]
MKVSSIFERAARLCGFADGYLSENDSADISARALTAVNTVLFDLCEKEDCESLLDEISVPGAVADAAVYGTAMYLSLAFGDTDKATFFSKIYSDKRAAVKSSSSRVTDALPETGASI